MPHRFMAAFFLKRSNAPARIRTTRVALECRRNTGRVHGVRRRTQSSAPPPHNAVVGRCLTLCKVRHCTRAMSQRTFERMMDSYVEVSCQPDPRRASTATPDRSHRLSHLVQHFHRRVHGSHTASTAQLPFNHGARRRSGAASCVPLSLVLQRHPSSAAPERINAASRCVTEVDSVPARLCGAAVVYLSGNALTSSSGVEQFACVHTLSLAHNLLSRWEDVRRLAGLPTLAHLRLEGNPLCASPLYRVRTVACLSRGGGALQTLDGAPITQDERLAAERVADWYDAVLGALVQAEGSTHRRWRRAGGRHHTARLMRSSCRRASRGWWSPS